MADLTKLYELYGTEKAMKMLADAEELAKKTPDMDWGVIQNTLKIGAGPAFLIMDWLADTHRADVQVSNHEIRAARAYALNTCTPSLAGMAAALEIGEKRALRLMQVLVARKLVRVTDDFKFERLRRMSSFRDLVRQMKVIAKKYGGRCEPQLLMRTMYVDVFTAMRLAQYGEEFLGLKWKDRPPGLM